jgi:ATP-dependent HslUV protease, peptidase subunit HslV
MTGRIPAAEQKKEKNDMEQFRGTTILAIRTGGKVCIGGDGQVSSNNTILKHKARKLRRLYQNKIVAGFAGATADAFTLFEKFEKKLEQYNGNLARAAVELAKDWRSDKVLHRLEALLIVANEEHLFILSGNGDVIEPDDDVAAIGSGGPYALAAARALLRHGSLPLRTVIEESMKIAAEICIYTNSEVTIEEL